MADSTGDRTEAPSEKRRSDFRKKGQVAQSREVQTAALFSISLIVWLIYMPTFWNKLSALVFTLWQSAGEFVLTPGNMIPYAIYILQHIAILIAPPAIALAISAFLASFLQIGWLLTSKPLKPDFTKLNPITGMARFVSKQSLIELIKSILKVSLIGYVGFSTLFDRFEESLVLVDAELSTTLAFLGRIAFIIFAKICAILVAIALLDLMWVRWDMEQKMKMTKQEQKEEYKQSEGDPHVKAQIRAVQRQMAQKRMMTEVPEADVIVTNPTHISVALKYVPKEMDAPKILASGADLIAMKIREIAREHNIPIVENPPLARLLHKLEPGEHVPEDLFKAVAEILAHVYSLRGNGP